MDIRNIYWYLGVFLLLSGFISLLPIFVAFYYNEPAIPFLISGVISCIAGAVLMQSPKKELGFGDAMLLVALSLLVLSFFGAIPFFMALEGGLAEVLLDGYFESISGYTTTGLSILPGHMLQPASQSYHSLVFRRALSEWLGGLGIIVIFLSVLAKGGISTVYLQRIEGAGERIVPSIGRTARITLRIYLFYTLVGAILLWLSGLNVFHSLVGVMSTLSTGGFIGNLPSFYSSGLTTNLVLMLCMILGAVPFILHYHLLSARPTRFFRNVEIRTFFWILSLSILILLPTVNYVSVSAIPSTLHRLGLGIVSTMTSTGYSSAGLEQIGYLGGFLLVILMLIGGCSGSTAGGLKFIRLSVLLNAIQWLIRKYSLPESAVVPFKISGKVFDNRELMNISLFFFVYVLLIFFSSAVFMLFGISPMDSIFMSASAQGNNGLTAVEIATLPATVKIVLMFQMIAGRLEIFPILALLGFMVTGLRRGIKEAEQGKKKEPDKKLKNMK